MARPKQQRGGGGGKIAGAGLLVGLLGLAAAYFGQCVPGFGVGGGEEPAASAPTPPSKAEPNGEAGDAADALALTVDGERCRQGDGTLQSCADVCAAIANEPKTRKVLVEATRGTHAAVDGLRKCIADQGFVDVVVRVE